jgi:hypothetical protein
MMPTKKAKPKVPTLRTLRATISEMQRDCRELEKQADDLRKELTYLRSWMRDGETLHRSQGFFNGDEKRKWLLEMMAKHNLSQAEVERTLLPLRKPL